MFLVKHNWDSFGRLIANTITRKIKRLVGFESDWIYSQKQVHKDQIIRYHKKGSLKKMVATKAVYIISPYQIGFRANM